MYLYIYWEIYYKGERFVDIQFDTEFEALDYLKRIDYNTSEKSSEENFFWTPFEIKKFIERRL